MNRLTRAISFALVIAVLLSFAVFAHSGGTDSHGGHYVGGTNNYHYHHGHPAHQHENGVCPYEDGYNTNISTDSDDYLWLIIAVPAILALLLLLRKTLKENERTINMILSIISVIAGLVGFIFAFINPVVTIICALITIVDSVYQVISGAQNGFITEIVTIIIGAIVGSIIGAEWYVSITAALCVESFLIWVIGVISVLVTRGRFR